MQTRFAVLSLLVGCSGTSSSGPSLAPAADAGESPGDAGAAADASSSGTTTIIDVSGSVVDARGVVMKESAIFVADAAGKTFTATVGDDGRFVVPGVASPYDVKITPPLPASQGAVTSFFGLTAADVRLMDSAAPGTPPARSKTTFTVAIAYPPCPQGCTVQLWSGSAHGGGQALDAASGAAKTATSSIEHDWIASGVDEIVTIDVLVSTIDFTSYWHARASGYVAHADATTAIPALIPQPIGRFGPVTITADDTGIPAEWTKDTMVSLYLQENPVAMSLQRVAASSLVTYVPDVPGATFEVGAYRIAPITTDAKGNVLVTRTTGATTSHLAPSVANVALVIPKFPETITPTAQGTLSRSSEGLSWQPRSGAIAYVTIDGANFWTADSTLTFARLARLGLSMQDGPHTLNLYTIGDLSLNELVSPDPKTAKVAFVDGEATTHLGFAFTVAP